MDRAPGRCGRPIERATAPGRLANWASALIGTAWNGSPELEPQRQLLVGRLGGPAWISDVAPSEDWESLLVALAWDAEAIDPRSCSLDVRVEDDAGPVVLDRAYQLADLPFTRGDGPEAWTVDWRARAVTVRVARGPRPSNWGLWLRAADGRLLDERALGPRVEEIAFELRLDGERGGSPIRVGDTRALPTRAQRHDLLRSIEDGDRQADDAAAARRVSTTADLVAYLRERFSCRAGDLLVVDSYLLTEWSAEDDKRCLESFGRTVRALSTKIGSPSWISATGPCEVRRLDAGIAAPHDRVWMVGDTAVLVGASLNGIDSTPVTKTKKPKVSTVADLPAADARAWRATFERWWAASRPT